MKELCLVLKEEQTFQEVYTGGGEGSRQLCFGRHILFTGCLVQELSSRLDSGSELRAHQTSASFYTITSKPLSTALKTNSRGSDPAASDLNSKHLNNAM